MTNPEAGTIRRDANREVRFLDQRGRIVHVRADSPADRQPARRPPRRQHLLRADRGLRRDRLNGGACQISGKRPP
ncbi:MAG TPA: hypothetical protein GYA10_14405 [Alphaproteobacteria bacterium]|nr:hypothetical protein [Alphaproteobacteria bacterium]